MQQLKTLYDEILRPELLEDQSLGDTARHTATPTGKEKGKAGGGGGGVGGGKKEKEREKGGAGGKEKKGKAAKEEVHKESVSEIPGERRTKCMLFFIQFTELFSIDMHFNNGLISTVLRGASKACVHSPWLGPLH